MVGSFGGYIDTLVRNNSLPKALLAVVKLSRKLGVRKREVQRKAALWEISKHALTAPSW